LVYCLVLAALETIQRGDTASRLERIATLAGAVLVVPLMLSMPMLMFATAFHNMKVLDSAYLAFVFGGRDVQLACLAVVALQLPVFFILLPRLRRDVYERRHYFASEAGTRILVLLATFWIGGPLAQETGTPYAMLAVFAAVSLIAELRIRLRGPGLELKP
jgi:hypothetical protein